MENCMCCDSTTSNDNCICDACTDEGWTLCRGCHKPVQDRRVCRECDAGMEEDHWEGSR